MRRLALLLAFLPALAVCGDGEILFKGWPSTFEKWPPIAFNLYMAPSDQGPWAKANKVPFQGLQYLQTGLEDGRSYYARLTFVHLLGGIESVPSNPWKMKATRPSKPSATWDSRRRAFRGLDLEEPELYTCGVHAFDHVPDLKLSFNEGSGHSGRRCARYQGAIKAGEDICSWFSFMVSDSVGLNMNGASRLSFWAYSKTRGMQVGAGFRERGAKGEEAVSEAWRAEQRALPPVTGWTQVSIPLGQFKEDLNTIQCDPYCATMGNGHPDLGSVSEIFLYFSGDAPAVDLYIDDIHFE